jgi:hypothetical protein
MSSLDWVQIFMGFRYCLRRIIILAVFAVAWIRPEPLAVAEPAESTEA